MKHSRRDFLVGALGLTLGGCSVLEKKSESETPTPAPEVQREPNATKNPLAYRLSLPHRELKSHYKAIVVGSGYGASVIAARLTSKFEEDLCILERGKEWHPGDFPDQLEQLTSTFKSGLMPLGLIDMAAGKDVEIVCGNGLGGTSLINAAITIRPELNVFQQPVWPGEINSAAVSGELEKYYKIAESVLKPNSLDAKRFAKSSTHSKITETLGRKWGELTLNIRRENFGEVKLNENGYPQGACVQCGNCCSGCNYGAKNTLVTNYLYQAYKRGAKIFTQTQVERIEKKGGRYVLTVKLIPDAGPALFGSFGTREITADYVFLGAGSKGSTELLMRSESQDFVFSSVLGTRLSANGDVMGISYNTNYRTDVLASARSALKGGTGKSGTIISSYADYRNPSLDNDVMSQFLLLDGVVPSAFAKTVAGTFANFIYAQKDSVYKHLSPADLKIKLDRIKIDREFGLTASPEGALNYSQLYFACGHDSSGGKFIYDKDRNKFDYVWNNVLEEPTFKRIEGVMKQFSEKNGGHYISNPRSGKIGEFPNPLGGKIQATHPLGGCPMGDDVDKGVVNHLGKVYDKQTRGYHENLYVVDAAIIPHSLSATPLLTITALAERIADSFNKKS